MLNVKKMFLWVFAVLPMTSMGANNLQESLYSGDKSSDQVRNDVAKGLFVERGDVSVKVNSETIITEWNAEELFKEWNVKGFSLKNLNGRSYLSSGQYASGTTYTAQSKEMILPTVKGSEILFVQLDHLVEVETYYDEIAVYIQSVEDGSLHKVYAFSGKLKNDVETSFDITSFAGKRINFLLMLKTDETVEGKGWNIGNVSILKGENKSNSTIKLKALRAGGTEVELNLINVVIETDGTGSAEVLFDDEKTYEEYHSKQDQLTMKVDGMPVGNLQFYKETDMDEVNVVYAIDNSGSMSAYQKKVGESVPRLIAYSVEKFNSYAALFRFGQDAIGCSVIEGVDGMMNRNTFNLSNPAERDMFYSGPTNTIWGRNHQTGSVEQYYAVLKKVATTPFQKVENKLLAIVLMGDEPMFGGDDNNGDCDGGTSGFTLSDQENVAKYLKEKGAVVFVIQEKGNEFEYQTIIRETGGAFIDINNSSYDEIADVISSKLKNRYRVTFSVSEYECGQSVLVQADWEGAIASATVTVKGNVSVKRNSETELLDNVKSGEPVTLTFMVSEDDNCATSKNAVLQYVHNNKTETVRNLEIKDGKFSYTIPGEDIEGEKIQYSVLLNVEENGVQIGNPYVTHTSWVWELGILNDRPVFDVPTIDNLFSCQDRTMKVKITDQDGIKSATLNYKSTLDGAYQAPVPMDIDNNGDFYAKLEKMVGDGHGFYYYITAIDNRGLEANYGEASEPKFMAFQSPEVSQKTTDLVLSIKDNRQCSALEEGETGVFTFYAKDDCDNIIELRELQIEGRGEPADIDVALPVQDNDIIKNGYNDEDGIFVKFSYTKEGEVYDLPESTIKFSEGANIEVCLPDIIDELPLEWEWIKESSLRSAGMGNKVKYGDTIDFGFVSEPSIIKFSVPNGYKSPIILNDILINDKLGCFLKEGDIENRLIDPEMTGTFNIVYKPIADEVAEVTIYNNTKKQNPFIFYVKGMVDKKGLCKKLCPSVSIYDNNFVAQVNTRQYLSEVTLAVKEMNGEVISTTSMLMGGPATQSLSVSTTEMDKNKEYALYVKVNEYDCENAFIFNEKSVEQFDTTASNNCHELIKNLNVNNWGTMVEVSVLGSTEMMQIDVYTLSGTKTDVHFGPQLMGGPTTHNLYLNTNILPAGTFVLRVKVGDNTCSQRFVNVK